MKNPLSRLMPGAGHELQAESQPDEFERGFRVVGEINSLGIFMPEYMTAKPEDRDKYDDFAPIKKPWDYASHILLERRAQLGFGPRNH